MVRRGGAARNSRKSSATVTRPQEHKPEPEEHRPRGEGFTGQFGKECCPECHKPFNTTDLRPVQESCRHVKCRKCLITYQHGCLQCNNDKDRPKKCLRSSTSTAQSFTEPSEIYHPTVDFSAVQELTAPQFSTQLDPLRSDSEITENGGSHSVLPGRKARGAPIDCPIPSKLKKVETSSCSTSSSSRRAKRVSFNDVSPVKADEAIQNRSNSTKPSNRFFHHDSIERENKKNSAIANVKLNNAASSRTYGRGETKKNVIPVGTLTFPVTIATHLINPPEITKTKRGKPHQTSSLGSSPGNSISKFEIPTEQIFPATVTAETNNLSSLPPPQKLTPPIQTKTYGKSTFQPKRPRLESFVKSTSPTIFGSSILLQNGLVAAEQEAVLASTSKASASVTNRNEEQIIVQSSSLNLFHNESTEPLTSATSSQLFGQESETSDPNNFVVQLPTPPKLAAKKKKKRAPVVILDHITILSDPGKLPMYQCDVCFKKFKTKAHIKYHEFCQNGEKPFKCEQCGQGFIAKSHYEYHLRTHTGERPYVCPECGKGFNQRGKVTRHMRSHTGEKPFVCQQCQRGFANAQAMRSHFLIHTGERPFACEFCNKRFTGMTNLKKHVITHTGERPFMCVHCGKSFGLKWTLDLHLRTHSNERPYACDQCSRAFSNSKDLRRHMVIHSGERPFKCWICGTAFRRKDNLDRHIKNTHNQPKEVAKQLANEAAAEYLASTKAAQSGVPSVSLVTAAPNSLRAYIEAASRERGVNTSEHKSVPRVKSSQLPGPSRKANQKKVKKIDNRAVIITAEVSPTPSPSIQQPVENHDSYILPNDQTDIPVGSLLDDSGGAEPKIEIPETTVQCVEINGFTELRTVPFSEYHNLEVIKILHKAKSGSIKQDSERPYLENGKLRKETFALNEKNNESVAPVCIEKPTLEEKHDVDVVEQIFDKKQESDVESKLSTTCEDPQEPELLLNFDEKPEKTQPNIEEKQEPVPDESQETLIFGANSFPTAPEEPYPTVAREPLQFNAVDEQFPFTDDESGLFDIPKESLFGFYVTPDLPEASKAIEEEIIANPADLPVVESIEESEIIVKINGSTSAEEIRECSPNNEKENECSERKVREALIKEMILEAIDVETLKHQKVKASFENHITSPLKPHLIVTAPKQTVDDHLQDIDSEEDESLFEMDDEKWNSECAKDKVQNSFSSMDADNSVEASYEPISPMSSSSKSDDPLANGSYLTSSPSISESKHDNNSSSPSIEELNEIPVLIINESCDNPIHCANSELQGSAEESMQAQATDPQLEISIAPNQPLQDNIGIPESENEDCGSPSELPSETSFASLNCENDAEESCELIGPTSMTSNSENTLVVNGVPPDPYIIESQTNRSVPTSPTIEKLNEIPAIVPKENADKPVDCVNSELQTPVDELQLQIATDQNQPLQDKVRTPESDNEGPQLETSITSLDTESDVPFCPTSKASNSENSGPYIIESQTHRSVPSSPIIEESNEIPMLLAIENVNNLVDCVNSPVDNPELDISTAANQGKVEIPEFDKEDCCSPCTQPALETSFTSQSTESDADESCGELFSPTSKTSNSECSDLYSIQSQTNRSVASSPIIEESNEIPVVVPSENVDKLLDCVNSPVDGPLLDISTAANQPLQHEIGSAEFDIEECGSACAQPPIETSLTSLNTESGAELYGEPFSPTNKTSFSENSDPYVMESQTNRSDSSSPIIEESNEIPVVVPIENIDKPVDCVRSEDSEPQAPVEGSENTQGTDPQLEISSASNLPLQDQIEIPESDIEDCGSPCTKPPIQTSFTLLNTESDADESCGEAFSPTSETPNSENSGPYIMESQTYESVPSSPIIEEVNEISTTPNQPLQGKIRIPEFDNEDCGSPCTQPAFETSFTSLNTESNEDESCGELFRPTSKTSNFESSDPYINSQTSVSSSPIMKESDEIPVVVPIENVDKAGECVNSPVDDPQLEISTAESQPLQHKAGVPEFDYEDCRPPSTPPPTETSFTSLNTESGANKSCAEPFCPTSKNSHSENSDPYDMESQTNRNVSRSPIIEEFTEVPMGVTNENGDKPVESVNSEFHTSVEELEGLASSPPCPLATNANETLHADSIPAGDRLEELSSNTPTEHGGNTDDIANVFAQIHFNFLDAEGNPVQLCQEALDNGRILYANAAATLEDGEEPGQPRRHKLLYAEGAAVVGENSTHTRMIFIKATPNQYVRSWRRSLTDIRMGEPVVVGVPASGAMSSQNVVVEEHRSQEPPTTIQQATPLPISLAYDEQGVVHAYTRTQYQDQSSWIQRAQEAQNFIPEFNRHDYQDVHERLAAETVYLESHFQPEELEQVYYEARRDLWGGMYESQNPPPNRALSVLAAAAVSLEAEDATTRAAAAIAAVGQQALRDRRREIERQQRRASSAAGSMASVPSSSQQPDYRQQPHQQSGNGNSNHHLGPRKAYLSQLSNQPKK